MYTRYYDSYPTVKPQEEAPKAEVPEVLPSADKGDTPKANPTLASCKSSNIFGSFKTEDILLIALLFITASDKEDNFLMPLILGALLLA